MINDSQAQKQFSDASVITNKLYNEYKDQDGYFDKTKITTLFNMIYRHDQELLEQTNTEKNIHEFFNMIDQDGDGEISFEDLENFVHVFLGDLNDLPIEGHGDIIQQSGVNFIIESQRRNSLRLSMSFNSFDQGNLNVATDVFDDHDQNEKGYILVEELPMVVDEICMIINITNQFEREDLKRIIETTSLKNPTVVTKEEFINMYLKNFHL